MNEITQSVNTHHAGLIFINPFIKQQLEEFQLTSNEGFIKDDTQQKAIHLLNFIATGEEMVDENEVLIEKKLCGRDTSKPILIKNCLSEVEKQLANQSLQLISRLFFNSGSLSIENFRQHFLTRNGIIEASNNVWQLKIEKKTQDILLERIPWGFSVVKLPWMSKMIISELTNPYAIEVRIRTNSVIRTRRRIF